MQGILGKNCDQMNNGNRYKLFSVLLIQHEGNPCQHSKTPKLAQVCPLVVKTQNTTDNSSTGIKFMGPYLIYILSNENCHIKYVSYPLLVAHFSKGK